jgi:hypothetical protein
MPSRWHELVVGSQRGLEAWRRDGSDKRLVSAGAALSPRFLDDTSVVVVASGDAANPELLAGGGVLERISLVDGQRQPLAKLPPFACKRPRNADDERPDLTGFGIQDPGDFIVFPEKRRACMNLMDRNINMASVWVQVFVDLDRGKVRRSLIMGKEVCVPPAGVKVVDSDAAGGACAVSLPSEEHADRAFPFAFKGREPEDEFGILVRATGERVLKIRRYYEHSEGNSPSGRWVLLRGDQEDADYIHANVVLLDRETGEVFPIREGRTWPAPLRATGKRGLPHIKIPIEETASVVGETDVRWLGDSADTELLVLGELVVNPGHSAFSVSGEIAR